MGDDDDKYHYLSKKHDGHYDYKTTDTISTGDKSFANESGLPYHDWKKPKEHIYTD